MKDRQHLLGFHLVSQFLQLQAVGSSLLVHWFRLHHHVQLLILWHPFIQDQGKKPLAAVSIFGIPVSVFPTMSDFFNSSSGDLHKPGIVLNKTLYVDVDFAISGCDFP